jgi:hypothetical protein
MLKAGTPKTAAHLHQFYHSFSRRHQATTRLIVRRRSNTAKASRFTLPKGVTAGRVQFVFDAFTVHDETTHECG